MFLINNPSLAVCDLPNICTYLAGTGQRTISGNLAECVNEAAVVAACTPCPNGENFTFTTQAQIDAFGATYAHCTDITLGRITVEGDDIVNLNGLANVTNVLGEFNIYNCMNLQTIDAMINLTNIGEYCSIGDNPQLLHLNGLANVQNIGESLAVFYNSNLTSLGNLSSLQSIGRNFYLEGNESISNLGDLSSLSNIGEDILLIDNPALINLDGLNSLTTVGRYVNIENMEALTNLDGLSNLTQIGGYLYIGGNSSLTDISGVQNIDPTSIASPGLFIEDNPILAVCNLPNICTYLAGTGQRTISGNLAECVNEAAIVAACDGGVSSDSFVTEWTFPTAATQISFNALTEGGTVDYTWSASPSGNSGSGDFTRPTPGAVTLADLDIEAGDVVTLSVASDHLRRFYINNGVDRERLTDVLQWGEVAWTSMENAFYGCSNLNISAIDVPDLGNVNSMFSMFEACTNLNSPTNIATWNTASVTDMVDMFSGATSFNQPLNDWDVTNVTDMIFMFRFASSFNQPLNDWDVSNVTDMSSMFFFATSFNQPLIDWDVSSVTNMSSMFRNASSFNQPLDDWDVSNVNDTSLMFANAVLFNQPLNDWDVSNVTNMSSMFSNAQVFNEPLNEWDVSSVTNLSGMFQDTTLFNQPLNDWDVSAVTDLRQMFREAQAFNQPINDWDVSNVTNMFSMFRATTNFNQPLTNWDVSSVDDMISMFREALAFNQDISNWCVEQFSAEPANFSPSSPLQANFKPIWGQSCVNISWTGLTDSDWNNPTNWRPNVLPSTTDNIAINTQNFQPVIDATTQAEIEHLIVLDGNSIEVSGVLKANGNLRNNGTLDFKSNTTSTGQFDEFTGSITGSGEVKVERFIPQSNRAFRYISSSVNTTEGIHANLQEGVTNASPEPNPHPGYGTHITGGTSANGFDATATNNASMFEWNEATQGWTPITNTITKPMNVGEAYALMIRGDRSTDLTSNTSIGPATTLRFAGELHTGDYEVPSSDLTSTINQWNLVANPYQALVNTKALLQGSDANHLDENYIYIYDPTLGTRGGYATVDISLPDPTSTPYDSELGDVNSTNADENLLPNQAFFVKTTGSNPSLTFKENYKNVQANFATTFSEGNPLSELNINLKRQAEDKLVDGVTVRFDANYSNEISDADASKIWNFDEWLAIVNTDYYLSIEKRAMPEDGDEIQLYTGNFKTDNYVWQIHMSDIQREAVMYDAYLDTETALIGDESNNITFSIDQNIPESIDQFRFRIRFGEETLGVNEIELSQLMLYPNPTEDGTFTIQTQGFNTDTTEVKMFNLLGQEVFNQRASVQANGEIRIDAGQLPSGLYMVELQKNEQRFVGKLMVE